MLSAWIFAAVLTGCGILGSGPDNDDDDDDDGGGGGDQIGAVDLDQDGFTTDVDCDDSDATINPQADEICDGLDNDCDGDIDDADSDLTQDSALQAFLDADADGFGDPSSESFFCEIPEDYVADNTDCDDTNPFVNPGQAEFCDGLKTLTAILGTENETGIWFAAATGELIEVSSLFVEITPDTLRPLDWSTPADGELFVCGGLGGPQNILWPLRLRVGHNLNVVGVPGPSAPSISGSGSAGMVVEAAVDVTVSGLEMLNYGWNDDGDADIFDDEHGAIFCDVSGASVTASNMVFETNINDNTGYYGLISIQDGCALTLSDSEVKDCNGTIGACLSIEESTVVANDVVFEAANSFSGAVTLNSPFDRAETFVWSPAEFTCTNCTWRDNTGTFAGSLLVGSTATARLIDSTFSNGEANGPGGLALLSFDFGAGLGSAQAELTGVSFNGNVSNGLGAPSIMAFDTIVDNTVTFADQLLYNFEGQTVSRTCNDLTGCAP